LGSTGCQPVAAGSHAGRKTEKVISGKLPEIAG